MSDYEKILAKAAKLCSTAERCRADVHDKLLKWGLSETEAEKAIGYLEENNFLDEERFARYFVKDKFRINKWGRIKIGYGLRQKAIPQQKIDDAIATIDSDEYRAMLDQLLSKKQRNVGSVKDPANKAKLLRFAAQRGFTSEESYAALDRLEKSGKS